MPNLAHNYLTFAGDEDQIKCIFDKLPLDSPDKEVFSFNYFVKMPDNVFMGDLGEKERIQYPGLNNWHGWRTKFWGTTSDAYEPSVDKESNTIRFITAWSEPDKFLLSFSSMFPEVTITNEWIIEYIESAGISVFNNGNIVSEDYEMFSRYRELTSRYIHQLNVKWRLNEYLEFLKEVSSDDIENSFYSHYLDLSI